MRAPPRPRHPRPAIGRLRVVLGSASLAIVLGGCRGEGAPAPRGDAVAAPRTDDTAVLGESGDAAAATRSTDAATVGAPADAVTPSPLARASLRVIGMT